MAPSGWGGRSLETELFKTGALILLIAVSILVVLPVVLDMAAAPP